MAREVDPWSRYTPFRTWDMWTCRECGVLVTDRVRHDAYHDAMSRQLERFAATVTELFADFP